MTRPAPVRGALAGGLALLVAACGASPGAGVASLGKTSTTQSSTPAANSSAGSRGEGFPAGNGRGPGQGGYAVLHFPGSSYVQALKFSKCMRSHRVINFPDPSANGDFSFSSGRVGEGSPQFQAANNTCEKLMPNGGQPTAAQQAEFTAQALKFSKCMQAHGIKDFPDPTSRGLQVRASPGSDMDPNNPRFQAAQKACQSLMPGL